MTRARRRERAAKPRQDRTIRTSPVIWLRIAKCGSFDQIVATAASLRRQIYPHWQMQIAQNYLTPKQIKGLEFIVGRQRLDLISYGQSHDDVVGVVLLLPGDVLFADALAEFVLKQRDTPDYDLLYADQIETFGHYGSESLFFKPAWSPEFLLATDYIGRAAIHPLHLPMIDRLGDAFDQIDLWRLYLDLTGLSHSRINRIERPLVQLRPEDPEQTDKLATKGLKQLAEVLRQRGMSGQPYRPTWAINLGVLVFDVRFPDIGPQVCILVPSRNNWQVLRRCIASLQLTTYQNYEILIIDNESDDSETLAFLKTLSVPIMRIPSPPQGFSYSYINNLAARAATAEYLLFLNDDTEVISVEWLSQMVGWLQQPGVASVGARLIYPNGFVQHAGITHTYLTVHSPRQLLDFCIAMPLGYTAKTALYAIAQR
jgi:hypothetical protein